MMKHANHYNELLAELDQIARLIPMISDKQYGLALRTLSKRYLEVDEELERVTDPNRRTIAQMLAEKKAEFASSRTGTENANHS